MGWDFRRIKYLSFIYIHMFKHCSCYRRIRVCYSGPFTWFNFSLQQTLFYNTVFTRRLFTLLGLEASFGEKNDRFRSIYIIQYIEIVQTYVCIGEIVLQRNYSRGSSKIDLINNTVDVYNTKLYPCWVSRIKNKILIVISWYIECYTNVTLAPFRRRAGQYFLKIFFIFGNLGNSTVKRNTILDVDRIIM